MKRIAVLCEVLRPPLDEGVRILAAELARALSRRCEVVLMGEVDAEVLGLHVQGVLTDRWFAGAALARALAGARPEAILYVPWTSLTARTLARVALLRRRVPGVPVGVVALQPRAAGWAARLASRWGAPDALFTMGPEVEKQTGLLGLPALRLEGGVDLDRFRPLGEESPADLRRALGLHVSQFLVLHVGHLKAGRGVLALRSVQALDGVQAILVSSSSTTAEPGTRRALQEAGVRVVDRHLPNVEDYYRAADCYLFPVATSLDAIEIPLSVLEAMACDLPIVAGRFGGLPALLEGAGEGVTFVAQEEEIPRAIMRLRADRPRPRLRQRVASLTWDSMAARIAQRLDSLRTGAERPPEGTRA